MASFGIVTSNKKCCLLLLLLLLEIDIGGKLLVKASIDNFVFFLDLYWSSQSAWAHLAWAITLVQISYFSPDIQLHATEFITFVDMCNPYFFNNFHVSVEFPISWREANLWRKYCKKISMGLRKSFITQAFWQLDSRLCLTNPLHLSIYCQVDVSSLADSSKLIFQSSRTEPSIFKYLSQIACTLWCIWRRKKGTVTN